jgi:hypothetical protein
MNEGQEIMVRLSSKQQAWGPASLMMRIAK